MQGRALIFAFEEEEGKRPVSCCLFLFPDVAIQYPQFFGHSYVTFDPLKNSHQAFQITLEFRVRGIPCLMSVHWTSSHRREEEKWEGLGGK